MQTNKLTRDLRTYLSKHGEPLVLPPNYKTSASCTALRSICVVPAFDESPEQLLAMTAAPSEQGHALVFVLNAPENAASKALANTQACRDQLIRCLALVQLSDELWLGQTQSCAQVWLLDLCVQGRLLKPKQGVGLARKLGLDFALHLCLHQLERNEQGPAWLMSCDADVALPPGYFDIATPQEGEVACVYPVTHQPEAGLEQAMALYDIRLDYYVEQLERAGSPYALQTLGSAIAVTPLAYAQVHGIPKIAAGEDFYLLNKLAKLGGLEGQAIRRLSQPVLSVAGRVSERVPFGTGPALAEIQTLASPVSEYRYYHPKCFQFLGELLALARDFNGTELAQFERALEQASLLAGSRLREILREQGIAKFFEHLTRQGHKQGFWPLFCIWFDGFRTLRLLNELRERDCLSINLHCLAGHPHLLSEDLSARIARILETANADDNVKASQ